MKPLPSVPLTSEDSWIWGFASYPRDICDSCFARTLYGESMEQDRRDAELMWWAQRHPEHFEVIPVSADPLDPYRIHIRAWIAPPEVASEGEWPE